MTGEPSFVSRKISLSGIELRFPPFSTAPKFLSRRAPLAACGLAGLAVCLLAQPARAQTQTPPASRAPDALSPLIVTEKEQDEESYPVTEATTATRTDTPIARTPLSIQVVPQSIIEDQGVFRLKDVYRNVSGVAPVKTEGLGIQFENAVIRGFSQLMSLDGVNLYTMAPMNLAGVERVEVLKGPASSLYGAIEPGGLINVLPHLASFTPRSEVYGEVGSYDYYRTGFDLGGHMGDQAAFRIAGDFQENESFRDFLENRSRFIAPSFTWNLSEHTRLTSWMWYQDVDRPYDNGVPFTADGRPTGPITRNLAGPDHNTQAISDFLYSIQLEHEFSPDFRVRGKFLAHNFDSDNDAIRWSAGSAPNTVAPYLDASSFYNWQYNLLFDALWKFEIGATKHQLVFGVQADRNDYTYERLTATRPPINILNPVYPSGPYNLVPGFTDQRTVTKTIGGFAQEQMDAFDDRLHILLGGRVDYIDQFYRAFSNGREYSQEDTGVTGRAGAVYDFTPQVAGFANVSRSFNPNTAGSSLGAGGEAIDPTTGLQYEVGVKVSLLDQRVALSGSIYQITKDNVPVSDPNNPGFSLNGGELRSRGFEFDALGRLTEGLQVMANYAYTDSEVLDSTSLPVGARFLGVPLHSGSLWLKYDFTSGPLKNFGLGTGVFFSSSKAGDNNNTFELPGYGRWDAAMWYKMELERGAELKFQVNVLNILDKEYYESSTSAVTVQPGSPSTIYAKCSLSF